MKRLDELQKESHSFASSFNDFSSGNMSTDSSKTNSLNSDRTSSHTSSDTESEKKPSDEKFKAPLSTPAQPLHMFHLPIPVTVFHFWVNLLLKFTDQHLYFLLLH